MSNFSNYQFKNPLYYNYNKNSIKKNPLESSYVYKNNQPNNQYKQQYNIKQENKIDDYTSRNLYNPSLQSIYKQDFNLKKNSLSEQYNNYKQQLPSQQNQYIKKNIYSQKIVYPNLKNGNYNKKNSIDIFGQNDNNPLQLKFSNRNFQQKASSISESQQKNEQSDRKSFQNIFQNVKINNGNQNINPRNSIVSFQESIANSNQKSRKESRRTLRNRSSLRNGILNIMEKNQKNSIRKKDLQGKTPQELKQILKDKKQYLNEMIQRNKSSQSKRNIFSQRVSLKEDLEVNKQLNQKLKIERDLLREEVDKIQSKIFDFSQSIKKYSNFGLQDQEQKEYYIQDIRDLEEQKKKLKSEIDNFQIINQKQIRKNYINMEKNMEIELTQIQMEVESSDESLIKWLNVYINKYK